MIAIHPSHISLTFVFIQPTPEYPSGRFFSEAPNLVLDRVISLLSCTESWFCPCFICADSFHSTVLILHKSYTLALSGSGTLGLTNYPSVPFPSISLLPLLLPPLLRLHEGCCPGNTTVFFHPVNCLLPHFCHLRLCRMDIQNLQLFRVHFCVFLFVFLLSVLKGYV